MPLIQFKQINSGTHAGLWQISESADDLINRLQLSNQELDMIKAFQSGKRYLHWLASRVLLRSMLNTDKYIEMEIGNNGQPVISNFPFKVSITHSHEMTAVIISDSNEVGIDVELIQPKIMKILPKFLSENEIKDLGNNLNPQNVCIAWCAKEVMFKAYAAGGIDFKSVLSLDLNKLGKHGVLNGRLRKKNIFQEYAIIYELISGYVLAYTLGQVL